MFQIGSAHALQMRDQWRVERWLPASGMGESPEVGDFKPHEQ